MVYINSLIDKFPYSLLTEAFRWVKTTKGILLSFESFKYALKLIKG